MKPAQRRKYYRRRDESRQQQHPDQPHQHEPQDRHVHAQARHDNDNDNMSTVTFVNETYICRTRTVVHPHNSDNLAVIIPRAVPRVVPPCITIIIATNLKTTYYRDDECCQCQPRLPRKVPSGNWLSSRYRMLWQRFCTYFLHGPSDVQGCHPDMKAITNVPIQTCALRTTILMAKPIF